jgi:hypothetical protein
MNLKNIKKRDVMSYEDFKKSYDQVRKPVFTKEGENPDPGAHKIKGENLYVRNDSNPYKAFGIEHDEKQADINRTMSANQVDVFDGTAPGKDDGKLDKKGVDKATDPKQNKSQEKAAKDATAIVANMTGGGLDENLKEAEEALINFIKSNPELKRV